MPRSSPDLIVLDWMLPGVSGIEICRRLRARMDTKLRPDPHADGARRGGRSHPRPLHRRRRLRREALLAARADGAREGHPAPRRPDRLADVLRVADVELDRAAHKVVRGLREVRLGPTEFRLLEFLMESPGRVLSRSQLLDGVWGRDAYVDERTVDVHVGRLRKALIRGKERDPIRTVRGSGYVFGERPGA